MKKMPRSEATGNSPQEQASPTATDSTVLPSPWPLWAQRLGTLLIAGHLLAVFTAPLNFACKNGLEEQPFVSQVYRVLRPYVDGMYLDHGYFFFAPNPGPSHLVKYRIAAADQKLVAEGRFPDLKAQQPRLLYHRYFMLAETLNNLYVPAEKPVKPAVSAVLPEVTDAVALRKLEALSATDYQRRITAWEHSRSQYDHLRASLEKHLVGSATGQKVTLTRVEHSQLAPDLSEVLGRRLDLPFTYRDLPESTASPEVIRP